MSTHFLPRWIEARHFAGGSARQQYDARAKYLHCFNISICGESGFVSGVDECPGYSAIRDVKNYLRRSGCTRMTYEKRGRRVVIPLRKHSPGDCILPDQWALDQ